MLAGVVKEVQKIGEERDTEVFTGTTKLEVPAKTRVPSAVANIPTICNPSDIIGWGVRFTVVEGAATLEGISLNEAIVL